MAYIRLAALAGLLFFCLTTGLSLVHERQSNLRSYREKVARLRTEVAELSGNLEETRTWATRLETDRLAWEEVARRRMGYLVPGEVLVTWDR